MNSVKTIQIHKKSLIRMILIHILLICCLLVLLLVSDKFSVSHNVVIFYILQNDVIRKMIVMLFVLFITTLCLYVLKGVVLWTTTQFIVIGIMIVFAGFLSLIKISWILYIAFVLLFSIACINSISDFYPKFGYDEDKKCVIGYVREDVVIELKDEYFPFMTMYKYFYNKDQQKYQLFITQCVNENVVQNMLKNPAISQDKKKIYEELLQQQPVTQELQVIVQVRN